MMYIGIDGDDIGKKIERYLLESNENLVQEMSDTISLLINEITSYLKNEGASIIYSRGDNILCKYNNDTHHFKISIDIIDKLYDFLFNLDINITFSVGISDSLKDTYIALKYAKSIGKNCLVIYNNIDGFQSKSFKGENF